MHSSLSFFDCPESKWFFLSLFSASLLALYLLTDRFIESRSSQRHPCQKIQKSRKKLVPSIYIERPYSLNDPITVPENPRIYKICLTGGPCAGKTTSLTFLSQKLSEKGFRVLIVPEIPTLTKQGGGMIVREGLTKDIVKFQIYRMKIQMKFEDFFTELAILSEQPSIIFCDRGVMDTQAYVDEKVWTAILDSQGWTLNNLRDKRYNAVIHLVTAADGAENFYSLENNIARYENVETARVNDKKTQLAWMGHPKLYIIDNSGNGFQEKIKRIYNVVLEVVGLPSSEVVKRKYLLKEFKIPEHIKEEKFAIEVSFLKSENEKEKKLKKRTQHGFNTYSYSEKVKIRKEKKQRELNVRNYNLMMEEKDEEKKTVVKQRSCILWEDQVLVLDEIVVGKKKVKLLKIDGGGKEDMMRIPNFCQVTREVTGEPEFSNEFYSRT